MCLCRGAGKGASVEPGREGGSEGGEEGKMHKYSRGGGCSWTVTALNRFLICHFCILFFSSWRRFTVWARWCHRLKRRFTLISSAKRPKYSVYTIYFQCFLLWSTEKSYASSPISRLPPYYSLHQVIMYQPGIIRQMNGVCWGSLKWTSSFRPRKHFRRHWCKVPGHVSLQRQIFCTHFLTGTVQQKTWKSCDFVPSVTQFVLGRWKNGSIMQVFTKDINE